MNVIRFLPRALLSRFVGFLVRIRSPRALAKSSVFLFIYWFRIDLSKAIVPKDGFKCIADLFTRDLIPGSRPLPKSEQLLNGSIASPVDGLLRSISRIGDGLIDAKGQKYTVTELLASDDLTENFKSGTCLNFYLSPPDYHHVHSPISGKIIKRRYIAGDLWPVNVWALSKIPKLYCTNERVVTFIETNFGLVAVVMVGALNVGRMTLCYDSSVTNSTEIPNPVVREFRPGIEIKLGDRIGTFHMGSAVILLCQWNCFHQLHKADCSVVYGQLLD